MENQTHILLVNDNKFILHALHSFCRGLNILAADAENSSEAFQMLQIDKYDLVMLDVSSPVFNGFQIAQEIRGISENSEVLILGMLYYGLNIKSLREAMDSEINMLAAMPILRETLATINSVFLSYKNPINDDLYYFDKECRITSFKRKNCHALLD